MKLFAIAFAALVFALPMAAQVPVTDGGQSGRIAALESPRVTLIRSNSLTAQIDFRQGNFQYTNGINVGTGDYEVKQLNTNIVLQLTNIVPGVRRTVWILADGTAHTVAISTNGLTSQTRISYHSALVTNGSYAMSVTNRAKIDLIPRPTGEVWVNFTYSQ